MQTFAVSWVRELLMSELQRRNTFITKVFSASAETLAGLPTDVRHIRKVFDSLKAESKDAVESVFDYIHSTSHAALSLCGEISAIDDSVYQHEIIGFYKPRNVGESPETECCFGAVIFKINSQRTLAELALVNWLDRKNASLFIAQRIVDEFPPFPNSPDPRQNLSKEQKLDLKIAHFVRHNMQNHPAHLRLALSDCSALSAPISASAVLACDSHFYSFPTPGNPTQVRKVLDRLGLGSDKAPATPASDGPQTPEV